PYVKFLSYTSISEFFKTYELPLNTECPLQNALEHLPFIFAYAAIMNAEDTDFEAEIFTYDFLRNQQQQVINITIPEEIRTDYTDRLEGSLVFATSLLDQREIGEAYALFYILENLLNDTSDTNSEFFESIARGLCILQNANICAPERFSSFWNSIREVE